MERVPEKDVKFSVTDRGILRRQADAVGMAGRGDIPLPGGGTLVSQAVEEQAWGEVAPLIQNGEIYGDEAITSASRAALERLLHPNDRIALPVKRVDSSAKPDDGEDRVFLAGGFSQDREKD